MLGIISKLFPFENIPPALVSIASWLQSNTENTNMFYSWNALLASVRWGSSRNVFSEGQHHDFVLT